MKDHTEQLEHLAEIRAMMEKSSRFISLSGLSGVMAGLSALMGTAIAYLYLDSFYYIDMHSKLFEADGSLKMSTLMTLALIAFGVLVSAISFGILFTVRKAKREGEVAFGKPAKRMLINLFIPLAAGGIFGLILTFHGLVGLLPAVTLVFYGLALVNASKFTLDDIKYLGISEIILGLFSAFYIGYGLLFWAVGFGLLHIVYGAMMYFKYEKK